MSLAKQYTKELYQEFGYYATWLPGVPLKLGDIGFIEKNQFNRVSTLKQKCVTFDVRSDSSKFNLEYASAGGVKVVSKISGQVALPNSSLAEGDAGITVEFKKEKATLFMCKGVLSESISNLDAIGKQIIQLHQNNKWEKEWVVITELVTADSSTIIIGNSNESRIELKANAIVGGKQLEITDINAKLSITSHKDIAIKLIANSTLTPLFKMMGLKGTWMFGSKFKSRSLPKQSQSSLNDEKIEFIEMKPDLES